MGRRFLVVSLQPGVDPAAPVGAEPDLALSMSNGEGLILIPYVVLAVCLIAVVSLAIRRRLRPRRSQSRRSPVSTDPEVVGIFAVALVQQARTERWIPAAVLRLCTRGVLTLVDEGVSHRPSPRTTYLESSTDPAALREQIAAGDVEAALAFAIFDGQFERGERVSAVRVRSMNRSLLQTSGRAIAQAREDYVDRSNTVLRGWLIATAITGVIAGGFMAALGPGVPSSFLAAAAAAVLGIAAFLVRFTVSPASTLNPAGNELWTNSRPERLAPSDVTSRADGELAVPWAMLFNRYAAVEHLAKICVRAGPPTWYSWEGEFTPSRLVSCVRSLETPITVSPVSEAVQPSGRSAGEMSGNNLGIVQEHVDGGGDLGGGGGGDGGGDGGW